MKRCLLFDLDGTLTDPKEGILESTRYALATLGKSSPADDILTGLIGPPLRNVFSTLLETSDRDLVERAVSLYRERYNDAGLYQARIYDGIPAMLQKARAQASRMFVATAKAQPFAERVVRHFGLDAYFDGVYGPELDGTRDNKADLIRHILGTERVLPVDAWMIGDRAADIVAAKANSVAGIGALWGYGSKEELVRAGASRLCRVPPQLQACVELEIQEAATDGALSEARILFQEYASELGVDLGFQNFARELQNIHEMYAAPRGGILLARNTSGVLGCGAFRPLKAFREDVCEMKRLYVRPVARGTGAGRDLAVELIRKAQVAGYRRMLLDTLESLEAARMLYRSLGFQEVAPYYPNPLVGAVYMELDLLH